MRRRACCHGAGALVLATPQRVLERLDAELLAERAVDLDVDRRAWRATVVSRLCQYSCATTPSIAKNGRATAADTTTTAGRPSVAVARRWHRRKARLVSRKKVPVPLCADPAVVWSSYVPGAVVDRDGVHPRRHPTEPSPDRQRGVDGGGDQLGHHVVAVRAPSPAPDVHGRRSSPARVSTRRPKPAAANLDAGQQLADGGDARVVAVARGRVGCRRRERPPQLPRPSRPARLVPHELVAHVEAAHAPARERFHQIACERAG